MIWRLERYDTETRRARSRTYTSSDRQAALWGRIPRIDFTDSGHGIVHHAIPHRGKRPPTIQHPRETREALEREDIADRLGNSRCTECDGPVTQRGESRCDRCLGKV